MIELVDVTAGYGEKDVLHSVNARFLPGRVTALIGPNGCGKSTLLKVIMRILRLSSGNILIDGEPLERFDPPALARKISYLPQNRSVPDISVMRMALHGRYAYLSYPRRYRREDIEAARAALRWAGMEDYADESISRLSGGMQQKVYIAAAMAQDSETILMDEPTTYLDISHQLLLLDTARELARCGKSVVLVLHDISQALQTADDVIVLSGGSAVLSGTPESVYGSGMLEEIFGVRIERVSTSSGTFYTCSLPH